MSRLDKRAKGYAAKLREREWRIRLRRCRHVAWPAPAFLHDRTRGVILSTKLFIEKRTLGKQFCEKFNIANGFGTFFFEKQNAFGILARDIAEVDQNIGDAGMFLKGFFDILLGS